MVLDIVAALLGVFIIFIGARFLLVPEAAATGYGVSASRKEAGAYLSVKGVRDTVSGVVLLVLLLAGQFHAVGWFLLVNAVTPFADAVIVLRHKGSKVTAYAVHCGTGVVVAIVGILLLIR